MTQRGQAVPTPGKGGTSSIIAIIPGYLYAVQTDVSNWIRIDVAFDLSSADANIVAKAAPGTTDAVFDLMRSTDHGATFTTILPAGNANKLKLAVGSVHAELTPAWTVTTLAVGDLLRLDVTGVDDGTAHDFVISIVP